MIVDPRFGVIVFTVPYGRGIATVRSASYNVKMNLADRLVGDAMNAAKLVTAPVVSAGSPAPDSQTSSRPFLLMFSPPFLVVSGRNETPGRAPSLAGALDRLWPQLSSTHHHDAERG